MSKCKTEYITKEQAIEAAWVIELYNSERDELEEEIKAMPAADVAPVVHGRWLRHGEIPAGQNNLEERLLYECSNCGARQIVYNDRFIGLYKFCSTCGARMDGDCND